MNNPWPPVLRPELRGDAPAKLKDELLPRSQRRCIEVDDVVSEEVDPALNAHLRDIAF